LVQFEIMQRPPDERTPDNPWPQWPRVYKLDYGQEEAAELYGGDPREYAILTKEFLGDADGNLTGLRTVRVEWERGADGRTNMVEVLGTDQIWPAQLVMIAMGFLGPEDTVLEQLGVERDSRSNAKADHGSFVTNLPGVFAAGDMRRGQSLVVWAINEGRGAARECDRYLMGSTVLP
jgi:glutamate synthase (NADPH/NADH) small chain